MTPIFSVVLVLLVKCTGTCFTDSPESCYALRSAALRFFRGPGLLRYGNIRYARSISPRVARGKDCFGSQVESPDLRHHITRAVCRLPVCDISSVLVFHFVPERRPPTSSLRFGRAGFFSFRRGRGCSGSERHSRTVNKSYPGRILLGNDHPVSPERLPQASTH